MEGHGTPSSVDDYGLFDILDRKIIEQLIKGYFVNVKKAVTLRYAKYDPQSKKWLICDKEICPIKLKKVTKFKNMFCVKLRENGADATCKDFDKKIAQLYVDGKLEGTLYEYKCWMNIINYAYPLYIGKQVKGVLFAGQILADESIHIEDIKKNISGVMQDRNLINELEEVLDEEFYKQQSRKNYKDKRLKTFNEFGELVQKIIKKLYEAKRETAIRNHIHDFSLKLAQMPLLKPNEWWKFFSSHLKKYYKRLNIKKIEVFIRQGARYKRKSPADDQDFTIRTKEVSTATEINKLINRKDIADEENTLKNIMESDGEVLIYRGEEIAGSKSISTLLIFELDNSFDDNENEMLDMFCRTIVLWINIIQVYFKLQDTQEEYKLRVGELAHSFRTPLQILFSSLFSIKSLKEIRSNHRYDKLIDDAINSVTDARIDVNYLLENLKEKSETFNLVESLEDIMTFCLPLAEDKKCRIEKKGGWPENIYIYGNKNSIRRAFVNLFENAVKYSWSGYEIRVWLEPAGEEMIRLKITNFGIGIPEDDIDRIMDFGERGNIYDEKEARSGTGWGLPIAQHILIENRGYLEINSYPDKDILRKNIENSYCKYITEVMCFLPYSK